MNADEFISAVLADIAAGKDREKQKRQEEAEDAYYDGLGAELEKGQLPGCKYGGRGFGRRRTE